jgi:hypothetical protein
VSELRINHDDDPADVMDRVNAALAPHGLRFADDGGIHDGQVVYHLESRAPRIVVEEEE